MLQCSLGMLAILGMLYVYGGYTESFATMGDYPSSQSSPLLVDSYPVKKTPALSTDGSEQLYPKQPRTAMSSYDQVTNNNRYWKTPNNGTCSPGEFCNAIYDTKQSLDSVAIPVPADEPTRVNYYNIETR